MIDLTALLKRSYQIFARYKFLWLFGFLFALSGGSGPNFNFSGGDNKQIIDALNKALGKLSPITIPLIITLAVIAVVIGIIFFIINYVSQGALISSVNNIEQGLEADIHTGFSQGWRYWLPLLGIDIVIFAPVFLALILALTVLIGPGIVALVMKKTVLGIILLIVGCIIAIILIVITVAFTTLLRLFSQRFRITKDKKVFESLPSAYKLIKSNIGTSILIWLLGLVISFAATFVIIIPFALLAIPVIAIGFLSVIAAVIIAIPLLLLYVFVLGLLETYISTYWTLAFLELTTANQTVK